MTADAAGILGIVPARGGSSRIKRKNLRAINGTPLFLIAARTLKDAGCRVVVSTDDSEIATLARLHGYRVHHREYVPVNHPPVLDAAREVAKEYLSDTVVVLQPTCPFISARAVSEMIDAFDGHTLQACGAKQEWLGCYVTSDFRYPDPAWGIGERDESLASDAWGKLFEVPADEAVDIDTYGELWEAQRGGKTVCFRIVANERLGAGHLRRCLTLASELAHHKIVFLMRDCDEWAYDAVELEGYEALEDHVRLPSWMQPGSVLVNDCLDTAPNDVLPAIQEGYRVVCLEDFGKGSRYADIIVQELYEDVRGGALTGPDWAVMRPEFLYAPKYRVREKASRLFVTFGGTDPAGLHERVNTNEGLGRKLDEMGVALEQPGFAPIDNMAEKMLNTDLVLTSSGRTAHEAACLGVPVVTISANAREEMHTHCPGVLRMGLHAMVSDGDIEEVVVRVLEDYELRQELSERLKGASDWQGHARLSWRIEGLMRGYE